MLSGKKAYICSPLSAPTPEGVSHNMEMAKFYLLRMKQIYHCRTFASHAHLPLMLDDSIPPGGARCRPPYRNGDDETL